MKAVVPTLRIHDWEPCRLFYVQGLGFGVDWEWRDAPHNPAIRQLRRDQAVLYLSEREEDGFPGAVVHLYVEDVDAWHRDLAERGVEVGGPPSDRPWGNREFRLRDPVGNVLCLCTPAGQRRPA
ncbi:MAG: glyoxalase superfamily protein [Proteobacteria bacterium]|nr:glyoxalase superfamily protein [Pseudomonadota bacterium]